MFCSKKFRLRDILILRLSCPSTCGMFAYVCVVCFVHKPVLLDRDLSAVSNEPNKHLHMQATVFSNTYNIIVLL